MAMRFTCSNPACGTEADVPAGAEGRTARCPSCGRVQLMPGGPSHDEADVPVLRVPTGEPSAPERRRVPLLPGERRRLAHLSAGRVRLARVGVTAVTGGVVAGLAWLVYSCVATYTARQRIEKLLYQAARAKNPEEIAAELAPRLPLVVSHCNKLFRTRDPEVLVPLHNGLRAVIGRLPRDTDLTPLLDLAPQLDAARRAALAVVRRRADRAWLLERSCAGGEAARAFAVEALRPSFPLAELRDDEAASLARPTSVAEKTKLYAQVYDVVHRRLEARWTGTYKLHVDAKWNPLILPMTAHRWTSKSTPVHVSCDKRLWRVKLLDGEWSGAVDGLPKLELACPVSRLSEAGLAVAPFHTLRASRLTIRFRDGFTARIHPVPRFSQATTGTTPLDEKHRVPRGATVTGVAIGKKHGFPAPVVQWSLPPTAGFQAFTISLRRQSE